MFSELHRFPHHGRSRCRQRTHCRVEESASLADGKVDGVFGGLSARTGHASPRSSVIYASLFLAVRRLILPPAGVERRADFNPPLKLRQWDAGSGTADQPVVRRISASRADVNPPYCLTEGPRLRQIFIRPTNRSVGRPWLSRQLRLLLETVDAVGDALLLAVHRPQLGQDEPHRAVKAHDHRGQYLHVVAHRVHFVEHPLLLAGEELEGDRFVGHDANVISPDASDKRPWLHSVYVGRRQPAFFAKSSKKSAP
jgi:hypothetical protein